MGFGSVRTVFVTVCLGIWMQFAALQSVAASEFSLPFYLNAFAKRLLPQPPILTSITLKKNTLLFSMRPKERIALLTSKRPEERPNFQWKCLAEALYFEARGELVKGQFGVAEVILNRVASPEFPNSICRVVNQGTGRKHACQFSYTCDGKLEHIANGAAYDQVGRVARVMMDGGTRRLTEGATYYHTTAVRPSWARRFEHTATIGVHKFYKPVRRVAKK